jgi:hypothetical protein
VQLRSPWSGALTRQNASPRQHSRAQNGHRQALFATQSATQIDLALQGTALGIILLFAVWRRLRLPCCPASSGRSRRSRLGAVPGRTADDRGTPHEIAQACACRESHPRLWPAGCTPGGDDAGLCGKPGTRLVPNLALSTLKPGIRHGMALTNDSGPGCRRRLNSERFRCLKSERLCGV